jgi:hypothetical protein
MVGLPRLDVHVNRRSRWMLMGPWRTQREVVTGSGIGEMGRCKLLGSSRLLPSLGRREAYLAKRKPVEFWKVRRALVFGSRMWYICGKNWCFVFGLEAQWYVTVPHVPHVPHSRIFYTDYFSFVHSRPPCARLCLRMSLPFACCVLLHVLLLQIFKSLSTTVRRILHNNSYL